MNIPVKYKNCVALIYDVLARCLLKAMKFCGIRKDGLIKLAVTPNEDQIAQAILDARKSFQFELEGRGLFTAHLRTFQDDTDIAVYQSAYITQRGINPQNASYQALYNGYLLGTVRILVDSYPPGFVPEASTTEELEKIVEVITEKEQSFRKGTNGQPPVVDEQLPSQAIVASL
jgi:hypothetical protein